MNEIDGVREITAPTTRSPSGPPRGARELLRSARLRCQKGGPEHTALDCVDCPHFVNYVPSPDRRRLTVRCVWSDDDPVAALMTRAGAFVTVAGETTIAEADERARTEGIRHLFVTDGTALVGLVCRCDLVTAMADGVGERPVRARMTRSLVVVRPDATLAEAARTMRTAHVGCLPVVWRGDLCGVITRGDLRRAGADESRLGARLCTACGSTHGVCAHPRLGVELCLACLEVRH